MKKFFHSFYIQIHFILMWTTKAYYWPYYDKYPFILYPISKGLEKVFYTILPRPMFLQNEAYNAFKKDYGWKGEQMNQDKNSCKKSFVIILWALCLNANIFYYIVKNKMAYQDYLMITQNCMIHSFKMNIEFSKKASPIHFKFVDALNCCHITWFTQEDWLTCWQICFYALLYCIKSFLHNWIVAKSV